MKLLIVGLCALSLLALGTPAAIAGPANPLPPFGVCSNLAGSCQATACVGFSDELPFCVDIAPTLP